MKAMSSFDYLRNAASKYGNFWLTSEFEDFAANLTEVQRKELGEVYEVAKQRGDAYALSRWIDECAEARGRVAGQDYEFSRLVAGLLLLFNFLSRKGIQPFATGDVEYIEVARKPNWGNLPEEFHYLIEPAEACAAQSTDSEKVDFLQQIHPADMDLLARTAERMRVNDHWPTLNEWMDKFPIDQHYEAWLVYSLVGLMDHAGLKFEADLN